MSKEGDKHTRSLVDQDGVRWFRRFDNKWYKKVEIHESKGYAEVRAARLRAAIGRGVRMVKVKMPAHLTIYSGGAWAIYAEVKR